MARRSNETDCFRFLAQALNWGRAPNKADNSGGLLLLELIRVADRIVKFILVKAILKY